MSAGEGAAAASDARETTGAAAGAGAHETAGAAELAEILALETVPPARVATLWDSLRPATVDEIAGSRWKGTGLDTGHPMFGMLGEMRWWGKDFTDPRRVDPILVTDASGAVVPDTSATGGGGASLWEVTFRGRPTASMVYDRLPVIDHFVVVDTSAGTNANTGTGTGTVPDPGADAVPGSSPGAGSGGRPVTLLAVMNGRGTVSDGEHFWFVLHREA